MTEYRNRINSNTEALASQLSLPLIKSEIFCKGIKLNEADFNLLKNQNPFNKNRSGLSGGRFITLNQENKRSFVNIPFWEPWIPYSNLSLINGTVFKKDIPTNISASILPTPSWINNKTSKGKFAGEIIQEHGNKNLAMMIFGCDLQTKENRCRFCTAPRFNNNSIVDQNDILETLEFALNNNPSYKLSINAGTALSQGMDIEGRGLEIITPLIKLIRKYFPNLRIMLEIAPPKKSEWFEKLAEANMNNDLSLMLNVNFWSEAALNLVQPGKTRQISKQEYIEIWPQALHYFGKSKVSSCLLVGIEAPSFTIAAIDFLTNIDIIPELIAFRPTIGAELNPVPTDPVLFYNLSRYASLKINEKDLKPLDSGGCIECEGCSLTTLLNK